MELKLQEDDPKFTRPAHSSLYQPAVALEFFKSSRAATVTAETDCSLLSINRNDFLTLVKSHPDIAVSLFKSTADRLRYMTSHHK